MTPRRQLLTSPGLRRGALTVALLVTVLSALLVSAPTPAAACTCEYVAPFDARNRADAVLSGRVRSVAEPTAWPRFEATFPFVRFTPEPNAPIVVSVEVATVWKGQIPSVAEIRSQNPAMDMCGAYFAPGDSYLFYAMQEADGLRRAFCQRLVPLAQATSPRRDLWLLGAMLLSLLLFVFAWRVRRRRRPA